MSLRNFFHKKSLGQNFLQSPHYRALIADTAEIITGERVLEVGPGEGALTVELLSRGAVVTAIEKDSRLIETLKEKFAQEISEQRFFLIEADALEFDISSWAGERAYKVVANIPYYITGALIRKMLTEAKQPSMLVLLVQKEVAERIARDPKESILSLSIKAYGNPTYIKTVPAGAFVPAPTVDSAILKIEAVSRNNFKDAAEENHFFELVKAGFAQKRKLLVRNLEKVLGTEASAALEQAGVPQNARAEDVILMKWLAISRYTKG